MMVQRVVLLQYHWVDSGDDVWIVAGSVSFGEKQHRRHQLHQTVLIGLAVRGAPPSRAIKLGRRTESTPWLQRSVTHSEN